MLSYDLHTLQKTWAEQAWIGNVPDPAFCALMEAGWLWARLYQANIKCDYLYSKSSMSANSPGDGEVSPYLCPVTRQSEYETPVSMHKYSNPQLALSEIEPEYHEYQDIEHSVTKERGWFRDMYYRVTNRNIVMIDSHSAESIFTGQPRVYISIVYIIMYLCMWVLSRIFC